jgi:hypothetical protein
VIDRKPLPPKMPQRLEALWATDVFTLSKMQASLPKDVYKAPIGISTEPTEVGNCTDYKIKNWFTYLYTRSMKIKGDKDRLHIRRYPT